MSEHRCVKCAVLFRWKLDGKNLADVMASYIHHIWIVYTWNIFVHIPEQSEARQRHKLHLISFHHLTSQPPKPELTTI